MWRGLKSLREEHTGGVAGGRESMGDVLRCVGRQKCVAGSEGLADVAPQHGVQIAFHRSPAGAILGDSIAPNLVGHTVFCHSSALARRCRSCPPSDWTNNAMRLNVSNAGALRRGTGDHGIAFGSGAPSAVIGGRSGGCPVTAGYARPRRLAHSTFQTAYTLECNRLSSGIDRRPAAQDANPRPPRPSGVLRLYLTSGLQRCRSKNS